jgi:DNA repair protein RadA/Sms
MTTEEDESSDSQKAAPAKVSSIKDLDGQTIKRISSGIGEVDRVLGGGIVPGEIVLLSGEPGIGKSTLLSQVCIELANKKNVLYVSGEESLGQLSQRFNRLSNDKEDVLDELQITEETDVDKVISLIEKAKPDLIIIDSIQSLSSRDKKSFAGSMSQVRNCGSKLTRIAKSMSIPIIIVGQVTKQGVVAGPKVLEHIVDAVLYFEGDEVGFYRILRGIKNRFGPTDEVGLFEMSSKGLRELKDPGGAFCEVDKKLQPGVALSAVYKGSRVLFVEIQALTSPAVFGSPRRVSTGLNKSRLEMLCAVLSRRGNMNLGNDDVFINVMGGMRLDDPSVDLAVSMAIASAKKDNPVGSNQVYVGEVGLSGLVYPVFFQDKMKSEARRRKLEVLGANSDQDTSLRSFIKELS